MLKNIKNFILKKKKTISLFGIMLVSSLLFLNNANAQYYNLTDAKIPVISDNPIKIENHVGDIYRYYLNTSSFQGNVSVRYTDDGLHFIYDDRGWDFVIYTGADYLDSIFLLTSNGTNFQLYTFIKHSEYSQNYSFDTAYIDLNNTLSNSDTFDLATLHNNGGYVATNGYDSSLCRVKFEFFTSNLTYSIDSNYNDRSVCNNYNTKAYGNSYGYSVYGSNASLKSGDFYFNDPDKPDRSRIEPTISYSENSLSEIVNETSYTFAKDITINYTVDSDEIDDYIYLYSLNEGNSWVTVTPNNNSISTTFKVNDNINVIGRILDKETLQNVYTSTYTVTGISHYEGLKLVYYIDNSVLNNGQDELYSLNVINYKSRRDIDFRLVIDAFDENIEHFPRLIRAKGLIYNVESNSYIDSAQVKFKDLTCTKEAFTSTSMECTGSLVSDVTGFARYEFYFDNVENVRIEYYDNADSTYRTVNYTDSFLKNYDKYYFDMNSDKAYINVDSINQSNKEGSIIIPYYFVNNDELKVELLDYDYVNNNIVKKYNFLSTTDDYYKKFEFKVTNNTLPVLTNKKGKYCTTYMPSNPDIIVDYTDLSRTSDNFFPFEVNNQYYLSIIDRYYFYEFSSVFGECKEEEQVYFYVSKDFKVTFNDIGSSNDVQITDNNFNIITTIDDDFNNTSTYVIDTNSFFEGVTKAFNYFTTPIREILKMITYIWNSLNIIIKYFIIFIFVFIIGLFALRFLL